MTKYPGSFILNEMGTRKELAAAYGVSERTIYRWLNKARAETGEKKPKPRRPRQSTLENFQGTRKELAKKYGVSERTVYRWLNKAKQQGADIPSRQKKKNAGMPEEIFTPDQLPEEIFTSDQLPEEVIFDDFEDEQPGGEQPGGEQTEEKTGTALLSDLLYEKEQLVDKTIFDTLSPADRVAYLDAYVQYQDDLDHDQFYNKETHDFDYSPDFVSTINIWGDEFESWLNREIALEKFAQDIEN